MSKNKALSDFVSDISNAAVGDYLFLDSAGDRTIARQVLGSDISGFTTPYDSAGIISLLDSNYVDTEMGGGGATSITGADVNSKLAALDNSVVPTTSMNLGSTTKKWRNIYTNKLSFGGISIDTNGLDGGNATLSGFTTPSDYVLVNNIVLSTPPFVASAVTNSSYTSFLLKTDSTQTDAQVDASSNSKTITENGTVSSTAFSPYHPKGYSAYFDGTGDYLTLADDTSLDLSTGDFTIEAWIWVDSTNVNNAGIISKRETAFTTGNWRIAFLTATNKLAIAHNAENVNISTPALTLNAWNHMAFCRSGTTLYCLANGVLGDTDTSYGHSFDNPETLYIGLNGSDHFKGYIADLRILKGTALYTSSYTVPTERLTAVTNTSLLTCHLPYIADGSNNDLSITVAGNTHTQQFGPYDHVAYSPSSHGGSIYMDGTGSNYYTFANPALGTGDFTVEFWIKPENTTQKAMWDPRLGSTTNNTIWIYSSGGVIGYYASDAWRIVGTTVLQINQWYHVAACRVSGTTTLYLNGKSEGTYADSHSYASSTTGVGRWYNGTDYGFQGNIADFRLVAGTAVYTAEFTPPAEPLSNVTNTDVLTLTNKNSIYDIGHGSNFTINGDTTASTTQYKWSSSLYVDGTGDSLQFTIPTDLQGMGRTGTECTIECWVYMVSAPAAGTNGTAMYSQGTQGSTGGSNVISFEIQENQTVRALINGGYSSLTGCPVSTGTVSTGQWTHLALVLYNNTWTIYINGTADGTGTGSYPSGTTHTTAYMGRVFYGADRTTEMYIEDLRISPHTAIYTSNFTPPTAALEG